MGLYVVECLEQRFVGDENPTSLFVMVADNNNQLRAYCKQLLFVSNGRINKSTKIHKVVLTEHEADRVMTAGAKLIPYVEQRKFLRRRAPEPQELQLSLF